MPHRWRRAALALTAALGLASAPLAASELSASLRIAGTGGEPNRDGLFHLRDPDTESLGELRLGYARGGVAARAVLFQHRRVDGSETDEARLDELYWDTAVDGWDLTLGKKRLGWGVGFGFRPLDVITPEPRRALIPPAVEGLPLVALERYSGQHALTALCGRELDDPDSRQCALRWFGLVGDWDLQALAHTAEPVDFQLGAGFSRVIGQALEIHGEALYQRRYRQWINTLTETGELLAAADPMRRREREHGLKALIGASYSWRSGHSVLLEYWRDDEGYSGHEWRRLRDLLRAQRAALASAPPQQVFANLAASLRYLDQPNLMRDNLLLRWSLEAGRHDPAIDLLYTPANGGAVLTLAVTSELGPRFRLNYGLRGYGGTADSVYRALPDRYRAFLVLTASFDG